MNESSFKESLRCFLEEYKYINGALKYLEIRDKTYYPVTEQFDVGGMLTGQSRS